MTVSCHLLIVMHAFVRNVVFILPLIVLAILSTGHAAERPNILWIIVDDMSAQFSCYGETLIETPHVDRLAERGTKFMKAFVTAPVCSTCRSAFITGMYQTSIGAHHHRSGRGEMKIELPEGVAKASHVLKRSQDWIRNQSTMVISLHVHILFLRSLL